MQAKKYQRVITYQSPNGATVQLGRKHKGATLRDGKGAEYCSVRYGERPVRYDETLPCVVCAAEADAIH